MIFQRHKRDIPLLNTSALPDLIFTILFFFILVTHLREVELKVKYTVPEGKQLTKLKNKQAIIHIFIDANGVVQIENSVVDISKISDVVSAYMDKLSEENQKNFMVSLKIDKKTKMKVVSQVKQQLRKAGSLSINYGATENVSEK